VSADIARIPNASLPIYSVGVGKTVGLHKLHTGGPDSPLETWVVAFDTDTQEWSTMRKATREDILGFQKEGLLL